MPELPDISLYLDALRPRVLNHTLRAVTIKGPFLLRTFEPPAESCHGKRVVALERLGKRIVLALEDDLYLALHLMIAGRLLWKPPDAKPAGRTDLAGFAFDTGTLILTEAGATKRASLHIVRGRAALREHDPGGLDPLTADLAAFTTALRRENHTVKRILTSPHLFDGIGNAYSDEILHAARLNPLRLTKHLTDDEIARLHTAASRILTEWIARLRREFGLDDGGPGRFPRSGDITAFRPGFAVHGKHGQPCPVCGAPVQRIARAESEFNYCPGCQTGGEVLPDGPLARMLKEA